jgi:hypothetical protein
MLNAATDLSLLMARSLFFFFVEHHDKAEILLKLALNTNQCIDRFCQLQS